jgi:hypothetical protein
MADELLMARAIHPVRGGGFVDVRMRVTRDGLAERSEHCIAPAATEFRHVSATLDASVVSDIETLLAAALSDGQLRAEASDPQGVYRTMQVWQAGARVNLAVEYKASQPLIQAQAFQEAWRLLKRQFEPAGADASFGADAP